MKHFVGAKNATALMTVMTIGLAPCALTIGNPHAVAAEQDQQQSSPAAVLKGMTTLKVPKNNYLHATPNDDDGTLTGWTLTQLHPLQVGDDVAVALFEGTASDLKGTAQVLTKDWKDVARRTIGTGTELNVKIGSGITVPQGSYTLVTFTPDGTITGAFTVVSTDADDDATEDPTTPDSTNPDDDADADPAEETPLTVAEELQGIANDFVDNINGLDAAVNEWDSVLNKDADQDSTAADESDTTPDDAAGDEEPEEIIEYIDAPQDSVVSAAGTDAVAAAPAVVGGYGEPAPAAAAAAPAEDADAPSVVDSDGEPVAAEAEQPTFTPDPPAKRMRDLKVDSMGNVKISNEGTFATVELPDQQPGDWVYMYLYSPDPAGLGWAKVDEDNKVYADLAGVEAGIHKLSVQNADSALVGWDRVMLSEDDVASPTEEAAPEPEVEQKSWRNHLMGTEDWLAIIGAIAIVELAGIGAFLFKRRRFND